MMAEPEEWRDATAIAHNVDEKNPLPVNSGPVRNAVAITTSDSTVYSPVLKGLYIGGAGNVKVDMADTGTAIVFTGCVVGSTLPIQVSRVYATGTTATLLVGLY